MSAPLPLSPAERRLRQGALAAMVATALAVLATGLYLYRPGVASAQTPAASAAIEQSSSQDADPVRKESFR